VKTAGTKSPISIDDYDNMRSGLWQLTGELKLLAGHSLKRHGKVEWRDGNLRHLLERQDEAFLRNSDILNPYTSNGEILFGAKTSS
jgi:ribosomal protein L35